MNEISGLTGTELYEENKLPKEALTNEVERKIFSLQMKEVTTLDILTHSLNCLALFAFTIVDFSRADFSFWFFPSSNPSWILGWNQKLPF